MSARRQARATKAEAKVSTVGGVPRCLALGPCVEVWAAQGVTGLDGQPRTSRHVSVILSARWRYSTARRWWVTDSGVDERQSWQMVPGRRPWSTADSEADTLARLASIGCTMRDLDDLAAEADDLHRQATNTDPREDLNQ